MKVKRVPLIAGNWKMHGLRAGLEEIRVIVAAADDEDLAQLELLVCPPATLLIGAAELAKNSAVRIGAQDCHDEASGAHTGDISAQMIADGGGRYVIVGHSERRADHGESDEKVRAKAVMAQRAGLVPVICIGESSEERHRGETLAVLARQLGGSLPDQPGFVLAYEPIWAIGTGRMPQHAEIAEVHDFLREALRRRYGAAGETIRLLYGGSVKPDNCALLFSLENVDGALIGGASLKASDFLAIARSCARARMAALPQN